MIPVEHSKGISPDSPLRDWVALEESGDIPEATFKRLAEHPLYDTIVREFMQGSMVLAAADSRIDDIFKDMGRYGAAVWAVYLHFTGGLTLPRLKEICARSGVLSPGRARALLIYLQLLGYVKKMPKTEPGPARYAPSDALLHALKEHARLGLTAMAAVEPVFQVVLDHFDTPAVFQTYIVKFGEGAFKSVVAIDSNRPIWPVFLMRNAGMQLLYCLLLAEADARDRKDPPARPRISIASLARQLNVARSHVLHVLRLAEKDKLLSRTESGEIILSDDFRRTAGRALQLQLLGCAFSGAYAYEYISASGLLPSS
ncbi:MAG: hypothetical protein WDM86_07315 [Rhizomicrobium sp.]